MGVIIPGIFSDDHMWAGTKRYLISLF